MDSILEFITTDLGDILMAISGIASAVSAVILIVEVLKSDELRIRLKTRRISKSLNRCNYLQSSPELVKNESFLYSHKNNGKSPCVVKNIVIDDFGLNNTPYIPVGGEDNA